MVSWRGGLALLIVLLGLAALMVVVNRRSQPPPPPAAVIPCDPVGTVQILVAGPTTTFEAVRDDPRSEWRIVQPQPAPADHDGVEALVSAVNSLVVYNTLPAGQAPTGAGLSPPSLKVSCRVAGGASYNLSVGNRSFDGSGYYAQKGGDSRVYVISGVEVDTVDQALTRPPVKPTPTA